MLMDNDEHEPGPKIMPDGTTVVNIPNNGMAEIDAAIDFYQSPKYPAIHFIQIDTTNGKIKSITWLCAESCC